MGCFSCFSISEKEGGANRPNRRFFNRVFRQRRGGDAVATENLADQHADSVEPKVERQLSIETEESRHCWIEEKEEDEEEEVQSRFNPPAALDPPVQEEEEEEEEEKDKEEEKEEEEEEYYDWELEEQKEEDDLKVSDVANSDPKSVVGQLTTALGVLTLGFCVVSSFLYF